MERHDFRNIEGDKYLNVDLSVHFDVLGVADDIERYVKFKQNSLINPAVDAEYSRVRYNGLNNRIIIPNFRNANNQYSNDITYALFTIDELNNQDIAFTNSFFILEYFDSMDTNNQTLLSTSFIKPMSKRDKTFSSTYVFDTYRIATFNTFLTYSTQPQTWNGFNFIGIPNNYHQLSTIYLKISFFNSKLGGRTFFHTNGAQLDSPSNSDFYIPVGLSISSMTYNFLSQSGSFNVYEFKNVKFIQKERQDNKAMASNSNQKNLILGSGDMI
jgi:hypothetical protein